MNKCIIENCEKNIIARGWCHTHYKRWQVHGDPCYKKLFLTKYSNEQETFFKNIKKTKTCWLWVGTKLKTGYGRFNFGIKRMLAHRYSYKTFVNNNIEGLNVCHHCDNPSCVNPNHLFLGTQKDNIIDCIKKNRKVSFGQTKIKGELSHYSKLKEKDVKEIIILIKNGKQNTEIAKRYNVCHQAISCIKLNKTWKHIIR